MINFLVGLVAIVGAFTVLYYIHHGMKKVLKVLFPDVIDSQDDFVVGMLMFLIVVLGFLSHIVGELILK